MKADDKDKKLDGLIHAAIGRDSVPFDFQQWRQAHQQEVNLFRAERGASASEARGAVRRGGAAGLAEKRQSMVRMLKIAAAAAVFVAVCLGLPRFGRKDNGKAAWAHMLEQIEEAETITWTVTFYSRVTSEDGERTWIETETREQAYMAPGLHRDVHFDENGQVHHWTVTDDVGGHELSVNPGKQRAILRELTTTTDEPRGPFAWVTEAMEKHTLEWVGKRTTEGREVNVFRAALRDVANNRDWSYDFWIDASTKQLVAMYVPGADVFDPQNDPASGNPPEEAWSLMESTAFARHHIDFNAKLDTALFSLEPPKDYTVEIEHRAQVTEQEMIAWLGLLAEFYEGTFPNEATPPFDISSERINAIHDKAKDDRTPVEQELLDTMHRYMMASLNGMPVVHFLEDHAERDSFRYIGKGVTLGDADRLVCWYRLRGAETYRVVYGDLSVADVAPEELPLPVEP